MKNKISVNPSGISDVADELRIAKINIESLPAGAYYLRLTNDEKTIMQKVIKQ